MSRRDRRRMEARLRRRYKHGVDAVTASWTPTRPQLESLVPQSTLDRLILQMVPVNESVVCVARWNRLKAILSIDEAGTREWYHASLSGPGTTLPTWEELSEARELLFQPEAVVVQIFPPRDEWFTEHDVLHLWQRIGPDRLVPDMRKDGVL